MSGELAFAKAHAVGNDFLIVDWEDVAAGGLGEQDLPKLATAMCRRHAGVGADGLEVVYPGEEADFRVRIFNSDGGEAEISGNGTRCAAADLIDRGRAGASLTIETAAGVKPLRLIERRGEVFDFEMGMGEPAYRPEDLRTTLTAGGRTVEAALLNVGNPQCAVLVEDFDFDWRGLGRAIETHPRFSNRTNVSFIRVLGEHAIEARFWERGAGETNSSGTGSTGAAAAAILLGKARGPVTVHTRAGDMVLRWEDQIWLRGPATLIARGAYRLGSR